MAPSWNLMLAALCTALMLVTESVAARSACNLFIKDLKKGPKCDQWLKTFNNPQIQKFEAYSNIPILTAVYCFNNGTGICKVLAGRFEFYFNSWTQTYLGPVEASQYVDQYGYHERVPIAYTTSGEVLTADRPINWSLDFFNKNTDKYRLLSATSFNWCEYATNDNWPYKSAILDHDNSTRIYFFNRQSCIFDPKTGAFQHYNTRFLHKSTLRIDLDYNPTIWAMENNKAKEVHLVKHVRQHFKEMRWELKRNPTSGIKYFVEMSEADPRTLILDGNGPFIRSSFYQNLTDICVSDFYGKWKSGPNAQLVPSFCGIDQEELVVYGKFYNGKPFLHNVGLHTIPRFPVESQSFFGVDTTDDFKWMEFANDGFSFSASTTIPVKNSTRSEFDVITLMSSFKGKPSDKYDENYPKTYLVKYRTQPLNIVVRYLNTWPRPPWWFDPTGTKLKPIINLNYVDDIAYLPNCETILVIFGPVYTEYPVDQFDVDTFTRIGSIYSLGANEMINAFFAHEDKLYFYHRTNFIAEHKYTCKSGSEPLVTATKVGDYWFEDGTNRLPILKPLEEVYDHPSQVNNYQEEMIFADLGVFKGTLGKPDAPDATRYPWTKKKLPSTSQGLPWWIWLLIVLGLLLLSFMFVLGFLTFKQRQRRRYLAQTQRSGFTSSSPSISAGVTNRSAAQSSANSSIARVGTQRSGIGANSGASSNRSAATTSTGRSRLSGRERSRSRSRSNKTRRSLMNSKPSSQSARTKRSSINKQGFK